MKRLLRILIGFMALFVFAPSVFLSVESVSAAEKTTLNFNLTCEEQNVVSKSTGDIVTVMFTLENATNESAAYDISFLTNEIYYDHTFFELVEDSIKVETGLNLQAQLSVYSWGEHRIYFNGFEIPTKEYLAKQTIGTFQLKVIAAEGSSTVYSLNAVATGDNGYAVTSTDLVVKIGDAEVTPIYALSFETNGGEIMFAVKKEEGAIIDLSSYIPVKGDYVFEGWYSDSAFTNPVSSVTLSGNITVYAKWVGEDGADSDIDSSDTESDSDTDVDTSETEESADGNGVFNDILIFLAILLGIVLIFGLIIALLGQ